MRAFISYARHAVDDDDMAAVAAVLRSDFLTTGPAVDAFEAALAREVGAEHAVACNSGTAALYLAARAAGLKPGDAAIVPAVTFVATASANVLAGIEVVLADVDADTGLMTVDHAAAALRRGGKNRVKAVLPVHLGGRVENPLALHAFAEENALVVIEDACHALGTRYGNAAFGVGGCAHSHAACFSFHPVKAIAMGEGGAVTTNSAALAGKLRRLRNHGLSRDQQCWCNLALAIGGDGEVNPWYYEVGEISHNFRASDINCALGASQLRKLRRFTATRRALMARYENGLTRLAPDVRLIAEPPGTETGWHLCGVLIDFAGRGISRAEVMRRLNALGVGTQVHYIPVHLQPYYRERYGVIDLPGALRYYERTLSLPLHLAMTEDDVDYVIDALAQSIAG